MSMGTGQFDIGAKSVKMPRPHWHNPIFIPEDSNGKTVAEMPIEFKDTYSHRAKATKEFLKYIKSTY